MSASFYFYDLETSGISPRSGRIMQFAGQRTDLDLKPLGSGDNFLIKMTPDVLPEPEAILITGITPQQTLSDGISEAEFLKYFFVNIVQPDTIFVGFNSIRFDDEFMRFLNYRNFYDAYEWQWQDGRSRWDLLDVARMTRALRPQGINWPVSEAGKISNRLEHLAAANDFFHEQAHDALSDVTVTIALAKLIKDTQPKLYNYLLKMRNKRQVEELVNQSEPFIYSSGHFAGELGNTTIAIVLVPHPTQKGAVFVYDLRFDPKPLATMNVEKLAKLLSQFHKTENEESLPVSLLQYNRCPAVAPLNVLDEPSLQRLGLDMAKITKHAQALLAMGDIGDHLQAAVQLNEKQKQAAMMVDINDVDMQLYEGFFGDNDKKLMSLVRNADENKLADMHPEFNDARLDKLLLLYKARQFPKSLTGDEQKTWQVYRSHKLLDGDKTGTLTKYFERINGLASNQELSQAQSFLLEELKLYGESIMPYDI